MSCEGNKFVISKVCALDTYCLYLLTTISDGNEHAPDIFIGRTGLWSQATEYVPTRIRTLNKQTYLFMFHHYSNADIFFSFCLQCLQMFPSFHIRCLQNICSFSNAIDVHVYIACVFASTSAPFIITFSTFSAGFTDFSTLDDMNPMVKATSCSASWMPAASALWAINFADISRNIPLRERIHEPH